MPGIRVENLHKEFKIRRRHKNAFRTFFDRSYDICNAVDEMTFSVEAGEAVGFIGPNGAGKSTTIKMMTGILEPTSGLVSVLGRNPCRDRKENARHIGVVFGQRSQLWWDLPVADSFELLARIYGVAKEEYARKVELFNDVFAINKFWNQPVRQLSLGQKMRAEFAASLLHSPEILFLDEPTIGLDVVVKNEIRTFIKEIQKQSNTTVILTTHDMRDVEEICSRLIMIDRGRLIVDDAVSAVKANFGHDLTLELTFFSPVPRLEIPELDAIAPFAAHKVTDYDWKITFDRRAIKANELLSMLSKRYPVSDMSVTEPNIEDIIRQIYTGQS